MQTIRLPVSYTAFNSSPLHTLHTLLPPNSLIQSFTIQSLFTSSDELIIDVTYSNIPISYTTIYYIPLNTLKLLTPSSTKYLTTLNNCNIKITSPKINEFHDYLPIRIYTILSPNDDDQDTTELYENYYTSPTPKHPNISKSILQYPSNQNIPHSNTSGGDIYNKEEHIKEPITKDITQKEDTNKDTNKDITQEEDTNKEINTNTQTFNILPSKQNSFIYYMGKNVTNPLSSYCSASTTPALSFTPPSKPQIFYPLNFNTLTHYNFTIDQTIQGYKKKVKAFDILNMVDDVIEAKTFETITSSKQSTTAFIIPISKLPDTDLNGIIMIQPERIYNYILFYPTESFTITSSTLSAIKEIIEIDKINLLNYNYLHN